MMTCAEPVVLLSFDNKPVVRIWNNAISTTFADEMYQELQASERWEVGKIKIFGKELNERRESFLVGVNGSERYTYSGRHCSLYPISGSIQDFNILLNQYIPAGNPTPTLFLLNRYNPDQCLGEHSDDEVDIDQTQPIWSLSLGQTRVLVIREKKSVFKKLNTGKRRSFRLEVPMTHGSLLEFCPGMQERFSHEVIKPRKQEAIDLESSPFSHRINLTARVFNI